LPIDSATSCSIHSPKLASSSGSSRVSLSRPVRTPAAMTAPSTAGALDLGVGPARHREHLAGAGDVVDQVQPEQGGGQQTERRQRREPPADVGLTQRRTRGSRAPRHAPRARCPGR
jgi:hypothetical protein